jgi:hypothetical protein
MSESLQPPRQQPGRDDPLEIVVTPGGQAWIGEQAVPAPPGTDPRAAAANFVSALARRDGRDISAVLIDMGRDERRRMIFRSDGEIFQSTKPMPKSGGPGQDEIGARTGNASRRVPGIRAHPSNGLNTRARLRGPSCGWGMI